MKAFSSITKILVVLAFVSIYIPKVVGQDTTGAVQIEQEAPSGLKDDMRLDSSAVDIRSFSEEELQRLRESEEYNYDPPPAVEEGNSFGAWLMEKINRFLLRFFMNPESSSWLRITIYLIAGVVLLHFIFRLFGVDVKGVFYKSSDAVNVRNDVQEEELHERDFPKEIEAALAAQRFREGVRLQYLYILKILSDRGTIHWEIDKTNREYSVEIADARLKKPFKKVTDIFEQVYYGDFPVSSALYGKLAGEFEDFRQKAGSAPTAQAKA